MKGKSACTGSLNASSSLEVETFPYRSGRQMDLQQGHLLTTERIDCLSTVLGSLSISYIPTISLWGVLDIPCNFNERCYEIPPIESFAAVNFSVPT